MNSLASAALVAVVLCSCATGMALEPVVGGPCEGCELVFEGLPPHPTTRSRIAPPNEPGQPLCIEGVVRRSDGTPAPGIIVYAYHTDSSGIYPRSSTRHGRLRGWARTDSAGFYRFETIRPGAYPHSNNPQHVHMHVIEPGRATYWIDEILFADDPLLTPELQKRARENRGGDGLCRPSRDKDGIWHIMRDIVLGLNVPGYESTGARRDSTSGTLREGG